MAQEPISFEGKSWEIWEEELASLAENTQSAYRSAFSQAIGRWETTPEKIYNEKMIELRSEDPRDRKTTEARINKLMRKMENEGKSHETALMVKKAMVSFFSASGLDLKFKKKNGNGNGHNGQKPITTEDIQRLIETNGLRNKEKNGALYMVLKDCGLRVGDIARLTVGAYREAKEVRSLNNERFKVFDPLKTQKCGVYAPIHLGPESVDALEIYLEYKEAKGEILTADSPIFKDRKGRQYTEKRLSNTISTMCRQRGFKKISAHSFRKRHRTQLEKNMPKDWVLKLQGKTHDVYSCPTDEELTERYMKSYNLIRVYGDTKINSIELEGLLSENEMLKTQIEAQAQENKGEIQEMKKQITSMMEFIGSFSNQKDGVESYKQFAKIEKRLEDTDGESDILLEE